MFRLSRALGLEPVIVVIIIVVVIALGSAAQGIGRAILNLNLMSQPATKRNLGSPARAPGLFIDCQESEFTSSMTTHAHAHIHTRTHARENEAAARGRGQGGVCAHGQDLVLAHQRLADDRIDAPGPLHILVALGQGLWSRQSVSQSVR